MAQCSAKADTRPRRRLRSESSRSLSCSTSRRNSPRRRRSLRQFMDWDQRAKSLCARSSLSFLRPVWLVDPKLVQRASEQRRWSLPAAALPQCRHRPCRSYNLSPRLGLRLALLHSFPSCNPGTWCSSSSSNPNPPSCCSNKGSISSRIWTKRPRRLPARTLSCPTSRPSESDLLEMTRSVLITDTLIQMTRTALQTSSAHNGPNRPSCAMRSLRRRRATRMSCSDRSSR